MKLESIDRFLAKAVDIVWVVGGGLIVGSAALVLALILASAIGLAYRGAHTVWTCPTHQSISNCMWGDE